MNRKNRKVMVGIKILHLSRIDLRSQFRSYRSSPYPGRGVGDPLPVINTVRPPCGEEGSNGFCKFLCAGGAVMSRGPQRFRQVDVTKVLKAANAAGLDVKRVEIDRDGKIVVIAGKSDAECLSRGDWDDVK